MRPPGHTVLVTGAAGFIGYHVCERLLARGERVVGVDSLTPYYDVGLKRARLARLEGRAGYTHHVVDVADGSAMEHLFERHAPARVVHLAAQAGVRHSLTHPEEFVPANLVGFFNVLERCRRADVSHLVYASSSSVYGAGTELPLRADRPADHPLSFYAATKRANELMAHSYSHLYGLPATGLRYFTVYGPWGRPDMAFYLFTRAILAGEPIRVHNEGRMRRDFTYIDDIVGGTLAVLDRPPAGDPDWSGVAMPLDASRAPWRVYNIGGSDPQELMHVIGILERLLGRKAKLDLVGIQPGEVMETYADTAPLCRDAGFRGTVGIEEGLRRFVEWYREYHRA